MNKESKKYVDIPAVIQVIGNIYINNKLLDNEKYFFQEDDFTEEFHRIIFGSIYNLHLLGSTNITVTAIEDYLASRPKMLAVYQLNKGTEWLQNVTKSVQISSFDYYYQRVKKMSLLRGFVENSIDISWLYDPDEILNVKKKQAQEDWLDNTSLQEIVDSVENRIVKLKAQYVNDSETESVQAGEGIRELLAELKRNPEIGLPLYGPMINAVTRGARLGKFYIRSAATGVGKAIPNNVLIPTPIGWRKVGDIKVGDTLFNEKGEPTKVLQIHPQPKEKEIWNVEFADGRVAQCCGEHLWEYDYQSHRGRAFRVEDTQTIYERSLKLKNGFKDAQNRGYRFRVKLNKEVQYPKKEYSLHPYIMGAFLGDASFRYGNTNKSLAFSSENEDLPNIILSYLGDNFYLEKYTDKNCNYFFKNKDNPNHPIWVEEFLKDYPELWNCKSEDKFIPSDYLLGSIEQRYDLLAGLLDTDGNIGKTNGSVTVHTISEKLKNNIIELAHSLGMITSVLEDTREDKYSTGVCYRITLQCKNEIKPRLFKLKRKKDIAILHASKEQKYSKEMLPITNIYKTKEKANMTCFTVDNENHLFLMNDFIVTHNTRAFAADACSISCSEVYNPKLKKWEKNPTYKQNPTLFIATEQEVDEVQTLFLAFISGVDERVILENAMTPEEEERVDKAAGIIEKSPIYIKRTSNFSLAEIENTIKFHILQYKVKYVFFDYLHSTVKMLGEISANAGVRGLREDNVLFMFSTRLKDLCVEYDIFIMTATQLNGDYVNAQKFDQNLLRGAKSVADKADVGMMILEVTDQDLAALQPLIDKGMETPDTKIAVYKNRRGPYRDLLLWCKSSKGTCRIDPVYATNYNYELMQLENLKIEIKGAF